MYIYTVMLLYLYNIKEIQAEINVMKTLYQVMQKAPKEVGDSIIEAKLVQHNTNDFMALDKIINGLHQTYSLNQIFKVYHQIFG